MSSDFILYKKYLKIYENSYGHDADIFKYRGDSCLSCNVYW